MRFPNYQEDYYHLAREIESLRAQTPDPKNYEILNAYEHNDRTVIAVIYKCSTIPKVLVFDCPLLEIIKQKEIDPHFRQDKAKLQHYPVARFDWANNGYGKACALIEGYILEII